VAKQKGRKSDSTKLFLSYSRKDIKTAEHIHAALQQQGFEVLLDRTDIAPGEDWRARLSQLIHNADAVVFALSPHSAGSNVCGWEVEEAARLGKRILPALISKVEDSTVPKELARLNFISFLKRNFDGSVADLVSALNVNLEWVREHTRLAELAVVWEKKGKSTAQILRGAALVDAEKWLATKPEDAAVPTVLQRSFIAASRHSATRRQRIGVAGSMAVALFSAGLAIWGEINRREAVAQRAVAVAQRDRAEKVLNAAAETSHKLVFDIAQEFRDVEGVPIDTIKKLLEKARSLQTVLTSVGGATPTMRRDQAAALAELAITYQARGASDEALSYSKQSMEIIAALAKEEPNNDQWKRDQSINLDKMAEILDLQGQHEEGLGLIVKSKDIMFALYQQNPKNDIWAHDYAATLSHLGSVEVAQQNPTAALKYFAEGQKITDALVLKTPNNETWRRDQAVIHTLLGDALFALEKTEESLVEYNTAIALNKKLRDEYPSNLMLKRDNMVYAFALANVYATQGDNSAAITEYNKIINLSLELSTADPSNTQWQRDMALAKQKAGSFEFNIGVIGIAEQFLRESLEAYDKLVAMDPRNVGWLREQADAQKLYADVLARQTRLPEALALYDKAKTTYKFLIEKLSRPNVLKPFLANLLEQQATSMADFKAAIVMQREALKIRQEIEDKEHSNATQSDLASSQMGLADLQSADKDYVNADVNYQAVIKAFQTLFDNNPKHENYKVNLAVAYLKYGDLKFNLNDGQATYDFYVKSKNLMTEIVNANNHDIKMAFNLVIADKSLGDFLITAHQPQPALQQYDEALNIATQLIALDPTNLSLLYHMLDLEIKLGENLGTKETRLPHYEKALDIAKKLAVNDTYKALAEKYIEQLQPLIAKFNLQ
jgi:tetratricopeptide (TPR) repeat protein